MSEIPVLVPTSLGPVGGIVCEPLEAPRAAVLLLPGGGRSGRAGFSSEWAHLSRRLAALGTVVLRYDFCFEGESSTIAASRDAVDGSIAEKVSVDMALLGDVAEWFRQRTAGLAQIVIGVCYGGRLGLELAGRLSNVATTLLVVPFLQPISEENRARWREQMLKVRRGEDSTEGDGGAPDLEVPPDPAVVESLQAVVSHGSAWILVGERDADDAVRLGRLLGDSGLEVAVEPGVALYPGNDPDIQELVSDRVASRLRWVLDPSAERAR
ncbi:MAG TPA: hypothetical protein VHQ43_08330 [Solirubrobacterales bacterium]|nr:hypothetical protein [Solirubrobacterales bacterium]